MRYLRYAFVSLISAALGVLLALTMQHGGTFFETRQAEEARLAQLDVSQKSDLSTLSDQERQQLMDSNAIDEIKLAFSAGYFVDGHKEITLRRNGEAVFVGGQSVERKGRYTGHIGTWDFYRLSRLIIESKQFDRPAKYTKPVTDSGGYIITIVQNGRSVEVNDYADSAPFGVWQVERAIVGVAEQALWRPVR